MKYINLKIPEHSYFFGFAQADGYLEEHSRKRIKVISKEGHEVIVKELIDF